MKSIIYIIIISTISLFISACGILDEPEQQARQGVLHLENENINQVETYRLDGDWEFYWEKLIESSDFRDNSTLSPTYLSTPGNWHLEGGSTPSQGYATYRLQILLPEDNKGDVLGLYIPEIATAYTLWMNGEKLATNGTLGTSRSQMRPKHYPEVTYFEAEQERLNLVVHVSDFYQRKSGWTDSFYLGSEEAIQSMRDKNVTVEVFLIVSLLVMGIYHIGIFILRPKDRSTLYFGGICLAIAMRTLLLGEVLLVRFWSSINWELSLKMEYLGSCLGIIFFLLFIHMQYREEMSNRTKNFFFLFFIGFSTFIVVTPARVHTEAMLLLQLFSGAAILYLVVVLIKALLKKRKGALLHVIAMSILLVFVINDILYYNQVVNTGETVSLGLFFYLFAQSFILSNLFTRALNQSEQLSERLEKANQTLEYKVTERTKKLADTNDDLEQANERLTKMNNSRQELMSTISHELGTPLTSIQGYIKGMLDGVVDQNNPKYLQLVYNKTLFLRKIIKDLRELARLESDRMNYQFVDNNISVFVEELAITYRHEIERKELEFFFINRLSDQKTVIVQMDPIRVEQVFTNLLFNARRFTPAGGQITVVLSEVPPQQSSSFVKISVLDTGYGIKENELPKIFERFYKGKSSNVKTGEGIGLGLAISAEIVHAHGGHIGAENREGEGSVFYFTLPVSESGL